jgi:serine/threonine protein kinase
MSGTTTTRKMFIPPNENHSHPLEVCVNRTIGVGAFGKVYQVCMDEKDEENCYALKIVQKKEVRNSKEYEMIQYINSSYSVNLFENLICFIDVSEDDDHYYLLSEKYEYDLLDYMIKVDFLTKEIEEKIDIIYDWTIKILNGVRVLHELNIIHRDIKPENILTDTQGQMIKICDFGLSRFQPECYGNVGSPPYVHPNVMFYTTRELKWFKIYDVYSVAVIIYTAFFGDFFDYDIVSKLQRLDADEAIQQFNKIIKYKLDEEMENLYHVIRNGKCSMKNKKLAKLIEFIKRFLNPMLTDDVNVIQAIESL